MAGKYYIYFILYVQVSSMPVQFHEKFSDRGVLMEIKFNNDGEEGIKYQELKKYQLHNFRWHLPLRKPQAKKEPDMIIRKPVLPKDIYYDIDDIIYNKVSEKKLITVVRNPKFRHLQKRAVKKTTTGGTIVINLDVTTSTLENSTKEMSTENATTEIPMVTHNPIHEYEGYDYGDLKADYYEGELEEIQESNATVRIKPKKEEHRVKEAMKPIVDVKVPNNCTDQDRKGYGIRAIECGFKDLYRNGLTKEVLKRFKKIIIFWFIIYAAIAVPIWLVKGWCCCCFRCECCFPDKVVHRIKEYVVNNPPGIIILQNGKIKTYPPSKHEMKLYKALEVKTFAF